MYLKTIYLRNFRNYEEAEVHFSPRLNVIWGDNAVGKTNLLEAICLLSTGRSFRSSHLSEVIREGASFFYLEAEVIQNQTTQTIKLSLNGKNKSLQLNASTHSSFSPLLGTLPLVLHAPLDYELITGLPLLRRRFLNLHLVQSDPLYVHHLTRFWRAMKQRNTLLRSHHQDPIECWEEEMAKSASYLHQSRAALINDLKIPLTSHGQELCVSQEVHALRYHPSAGTNYLEQLLKNRSKEKELGMTLTGPHRDDLSFWMNGKESRLFASEGQKKTAIAALRLAEWDRLCSQMNGKPLMAIDDLPLFLDPTRQDRFRCSLDRLGQVFITLPSLPASFKVNHCISLPPE